LNTNALKTFAQAARKKLLLQVTARMEQVLTTDSAELREQATKVQKLQEAIAATSKAQVIDKVAYTWFNRLMALRFMDVNDYQPIGVRVVTPKDGGYILPALLDAAKDGIIPEELQVDTARIADLVQGNVPNADPQNEPYKLLLIAACNHLSKIFPFLFERINDYTELLLPVDLISEFSIVQDIRKGMTAEDCEEVEIIGWLYQFYISERKDEVFASKAKVAKEDIPAATQLFTPRWIVEYMVQNTLGKLWLQNKPNSNLRDHMPYFIESPSMENEEFLKVEKAEDLTLLDQACGSGHILVYGFDLLTKIYEEEGYNTSEIPQLIIEKNLHGFEIDDRAAQLAGLALMLKARSYQRRVFRKSITPNILCYQDLKLSTEEVTEAFQLLKIEPSEELLHDLDNIRQATNFGSLILPHASLSELAQVSNTLIEKSNTSDVFLRNQIQSLKKALGELIQLARKYDCIVDNPPYMGGGKMNKKLVDFVKKNYPDSKADLMTCFMESGIQMLKPKGFLGMINLPSWLFLSSFEKLRKKLINNNYIDSLLHMGRGIFGVDWGSTAFIIRNHKIDYPARYFKLHKRNFQHLYPEDIRDIFLRAKKDSSVKINFDKYREGGGTASIDGLLDSNGLKISYTANQKEFEIIPGSPIGYWLSDTQIQTFVENISLAKSYPPKSGLSTANNNRFLRLWREIDYSKISFNCKSREDLKNKVEKWIPMTKGGSFRRWYGNNEFLINWENDGEELKYWLVNNPNDPSTKSWSRYVRNYDKYCQKGFSFSDVSSGKPAFRFQESGFIPNSRGPFIYSDNLVVLGYLNSKLAISFLEVLCPTLTYNVGDIAKLPAIKIENDSIENLVLELIEGFKLEDLTTETSFSFQKNELLRHRATGLEETYDSYCQYWKNKFYQLHRNEEELNRQFIDIYGLQEELTPDVPLEEITILKAETSIEEGKLVFDEKEVMKQFVSYAVGCMFGRYSLDQEGLILANQGESLADYFTKVNRTESEVSFLPDDDNIIPVLNDEWFEDDIVGRFYTFLKVTFGEQDYEKNLAFIEESLGKSIRKYFVKDFYPDHIKRYKKRPIYWMFSSAKGSFNALIYMHRYDRDTLSLLLNNYLVEYREKLRVHIDSLNHQVTTGSATEQTKAAKAIDQTKVILKELEEYEREIRPTVQDRIPIDLDDGVLVNYNKFGQAIKMVKGLSDKKTKEKVRKFDWIDGELIKD
jgi:hypothetical protein